MKLEIKKSIKMYELISKLENMGYSRSFDLNIGNYNQIGDVINIYPVNLDSAIRIDFFGDQIEKILLIPKIGINKTGAVANRLSKTINELKIERNELSLGDGSKIRPGNYIVHIDHGVGIFRNIGFKKSQKYIFIEYLNNDFLYVPAKNREKLSLYVGVGRRRPKLNKLGSKNWSNTRKKTYESIIKLARELLNIYAKRELKRSKKYQIDTLWDKEIRKTFDYKETIDQRKAIAQVYKDLENFRPMDRLVCGDVGFGKTEIALRAAVQAVANGYQAALLCPTTLLARQHYGSIKKRFKSLPIKVGILSRFENNQKINETLKGIKNGSVDFVIGTHKLLSKNIKFKNLDLLIIDEEQRFGVKQKEQLKKEREELNILTLSATPIPRTLFISLSGIRDISEINTPPKGRRSIETKVNIFNEKEIKNYFLRELKRGGQIYYLFNKVRSIEVKKKEIMKIVPRARIAVAHGQMNEKVLAKTMENFAKGEIDILICSTIIGSGIDLANVNTLVVEDADKFGLSQLYQIRGRIGRSDKKAYCLLTHKNKKITDEAFKRLKSMVENTDLGSGFNIALNDLEIRGGGNILGREQHGNMEAVGLMLYSKLLKKAVDKLR